MVHSIEHEKHQMAIVVSVLSYDLNRTNPVVPTLMANHTIQQLTAMRDDLLAKIDETVAMDGFYAVPIHMDATWLCTLLQVEFGSEVHVETSPESEVKCIVPTPHYKI